MSRTGIPSLRRGLVIADCSASMMAEKQKGKGAETEKYKVDKREKHQFS